MQKKYEKTLNYFNNTDDAKLTITDRVGSGKAVLSGGKIYHNEAKYGAPAPKFSL